MNRIILIGNGFDLAHNLLTSYSHFLTDFWTKKFKSISDDRNTIYDDDDIYVDKGYFGNNLPTWVKIYSDLEKEDRLKYKFKNAFLEKITKDDQDKNWVDIENAYFSELLKVLDDPEKIKTLNKELDRIKNALEKYLTEETNSERKVTQANDIIRQHITSNLEISDFTKEGESALKEEYLFLMKKELNPPILQENSNLINDESLTFKDFISDFAIKSDGHFIWDENKANKFYDKCKSRDLVKIKPSNCLFLNFNYTNTTSLYCTPNKYYLNPDYECIHIHGELNNSKNPIIFGYGDEISKDYEKIEEINNNDLLENVKSIKYLDASNYKRLLEYIDSDKYQVLVMGHSCGNSDRTLLNTLFEHDNCVSIKVYYHQKDVSTDDYSNIIRNISRNFKDKKKMRDRVVNKTLCEPLIPLKLPLFAVV